MPNQKQPAQGQRTMQQWVRDLKLSAATQLNLFYKNRRQKFFWEERLLANGGFPMKAAMPVLYRQGDVLFKRIDSIPTNVASNKRENGVIAYGEVTGHTHAIADLEQAEVLEVGEGLYVHVGENGVSIRHQEHGPIELPAGDYQVTIQREYSPEEIRSVAD